MISFLTKKVNVNNELKDIIGFGVIFRTPMGLTEDFDTALQICNAKKIDPDLGIALIPIVKYEGGYEPVF